MLQQKTTTVTLHDISGSLLVHKTVEPNTPHLALDLNDMPAGTYYVRLTDGGAFINTDMFVLVR
jgi:hypothetical protein